ncbi:helix-turn-helix domain-containing protein [Enterococcus faecalis]|uniref:helix-turn-helix domain-containing protein n=1 Tax=Enterococcus TaxID=1350 RepID=UPI000DEBE9A5|nr:MULTISPECIES: helix-turn-helix domain-containing protein [Enterococcus]EHQ2599788.1 helix-turn-helix domain-containing protein [Enterococcus faecalis]EHZ5372533.1 helix-turn-helix domain-containing protein [Enterococcus faecalis]EIW2077455.1 helix-turn-helix domain-containing protein [Enterococcus faecalis]EJU8176365.1 helix-turn-helix domain-containing protein [Enterococcus faecalis]MCD4891535.1 helix-turn-helix domain-containing protein [Enterococcus faecalis]
MELESSTNFSVLNMEFYLMLQKKIDDYTEKLLVINSLPLVLTNNDLKQLFQISDSTLNRLVKLSKFPACWHGIRGHYLLEDVLEWMKRSDADDFREQTRLLRSL